MVTTRTRQVRLSRGATCGPSGSATGGSVGELNAVADQDRRAVADDGEPRWCRSRSRLIWALNTGRGTDQRNRGVQRIWELATAYSKGVVILRSLNASRPMWRPRRGWSRAAPRGSALTARSCSATASCGRDTPLDVRCSEHPVGDAEVEASSSSIVQSRQLRIYTTDPEAASACRIEQEHRVAPRERCSSGSGDVLIGKNVYEPLGLHRR